jgi:hypothetical protein
MKGGYLFQYLLAHLLNQSLHHMFEMTAVSNLRRSIKILHNLSMSVRPRRDTINQRSSTYLRVPRPKIHNQPRNQFCLVRIRERCPRRARVCAVDGHFTKAFAFASRCDSRSSCSELAGKVKKESFGAAVLVGLFHAVLVVAEFFEIGAGFGDGHGEGGGVYAKGGDEGEDWW